MQRTCSTEAPCRFAQSYLYNILFCTLLYSTLLYYSLPESSVKILWYVSPCHASALGVSKELPASTFSNSAGDRTPTPVRTRTPAASLKPKLYSFSVRLTPGCLPPSATSVQGSPRLVTSHAHVLAYAGVHLTKLQIQKRKEANLSSKSRS